MATREQIECLVCRDYERRVHRRRWVRNVVAGVIVSIAAVTMAFWLMA